MENPGADDEAAATISHYHVVARNSAPHINVPYDSTSQSHD